MNPIDFLVAHPLILFPLLWCAAIVAAAWALRWLVRFELRGPVQMSDEAEALRVLGRASRMEARR